MMKEEKIRERTKNYDVVSLSESVQDLYNGSCTRIDLYKTKNLQEGINLLD